MATCRLDFFLIYMTSQSGNLSLPVNRRDYVFLWLNFTRGRTLFVVQLLSEGCRTTALIHRRSHEANSILQAMVALHFILCRAMPVNGTVSHRIMLPVAGDSMI
jgi:hypothetical protein